MPIEFQLHASPPGSPTSFFQPEMAGSGRIPLVVLELRYRGDRCSPERLSVIAHTVEVAPDPLVPGGAPRGRPRRISAELAFAVHPPFGGRPGYIEVGAESTQLRVSDGFKDKKVAALMMREVMAILDIGHPGLQYGSASGRIGMLSSTDGVGENRARRDAFYSRVCGWDVVTDASGDGELRRPQQRRAPDFSGVNRAFGPGVPLAGLGPEHLAAALPAARRAAAEVPKLRHHPTGSPANEAEVAGRENTMDAAYAHRAPAEGPARRPAPSKGILGLFR